MKKGFTLIELLVVITIIGILATGATALYSGSQQKARDSIRISDVMSVSSALVQQYSDLQAYPAATASTVGTILTGKMYLAKVPADPKAGDTAADGTEDLGYLYNVGDFNGVQDQAYEVSTAFEAKGNVEAGGKARTDGGSTGAPGEARFELGIDIATIGTSLGATAAGVGL